MSDIMIVGSANFTGSNLCNYFVQHTKYNISSIDDLSTMPDLKNLEASINSKYRHSFYLAEAENLKIVKKIFDLEQPKTIIYNLASTHLNQIEKWKMPFENAIGILQSWFDLALLYNIEKFVILLGSKPVYKQLTVEMQEYTNFCELSTLNKNFKVYSLKNCNLFGPRQDISKVVPNVFTSVLNGDFEENMWSGSLEDYMYIKDYFYNVNEFVNGNQNSGCYYLRNYDQITKADLWRLAQNVVSGKNEMRAKRVKHLEFANDDVVKHKVFDCKFQYNLIDALEHTFCWYDANKWAWR